MLHQLPPPEKSLLAFPPHAAAVKFDVVPPTGAHAGDLYVALFGDEVPMTAPNGPPVGRSIARVDTVSWTLHPLGSGPARPPIDVRIDAAAGSVYVLDFGQFEMTRLHVRGPGREMIHRFNELGVVSLDPQWAGGRPRRMTIDDETFIVATATASLGCVPWSGVGRRKGPPGGGPPA